MTELKIKLMKENQNEIQRLDSFRTQPDYLLKFASELAEHNLKIIVYITRKNNTKYAKIYIGDYLLYRPSHTSKIDESTVLFNFEGFDAEMKTKRSKQFKFFEHVKHELKL